MTHFLTKQKQVKGRAKPCRGVSRKCTPVPQGLSAPVQYSAYTIKFWTSNKHVCKNLGKGRSIGLIELLRLNSKLHLERARREKEKERELSENKPGGKTTTVASHLLRSSKETKTRQHSKSHTAKTAQQNDQNCRTKTAKEPRQR